MAIGKALLFTAALGLTACATTPGDTNSNQQSSKPTDRLSARELDQGDCGMFVWTADKARRFILYSQADKANANWWTEDGEVLVARVSDSGFSVYGQPPIQEFRMSDGGSLSMTLNDPEDINNGIRYKSGAVHVSDAQGWDKVIPVVGLAGCQSVSN